LTAPIRLQDHRGGLRTRGGTRVLLAAALAALAALAAPSAAQAQGALLDGAPLNVFADGLGAIQVRQDGVDSGLFYDPLENPGHAGLEIKEGEAYYPLEDGFSTAVGRVSGGITLTDAGGGTRTLRSVYAVGPNLSVTEVITYTDGSSAVNVRYDIQNVSTAATSIRAGVLADLYVGNNDSGNGVISPTAPRFVGGRDEGTQLVYGLQELTPWAALQEGDFELVFDNFSADGLNNTVDSSAPDNGVGVEYRLDNIAPGEVRGIDVRWLLAAPAPPGTVSPQPGGGGGSQGGVLPPPVVGKTVNAGVRKGRVFYRIPPSKRYIELKEGEQLPVGAIFDTTRGRVNLTVADGKGGTSLAWFYSGIFKVAQSRAGLTNLTMVEPKLSCKRASRASTSQSRRAKKKKSRKLWGQGSGKFRTTGQFSSATVRGTRWLVVDRCGVTETRVTEGSVAVRDFVKRKTVLVRAGKKYVARKRS
jgi:hypothetical protein